MIADLINTPCTLVSRSASSRDRFNNPVREDETRETVCAIQQRGRSEVSGQIEISQSEWLAFFLADEDLSHVDQLIVNGQTFEFVGAPWRVFNEFKNVYSHVEASLEVATAGEEESGSGS